MVGSGFGTTRTILELKNLLVSFLQLGMLNSEHAYYRKSVHFPPRTFCSLAQAVFVTRMPICYICLLTVMSMLLLHTKAQTCHPCTVAVPRFFPK